MRKELSRKSELPLLTICLRAVDDVVKSKTTIEEEKVESARS